MFGYAGKILRVCLTDEEIKEERLPKEVARKYVGGRCLAAKILFEELEPRIDPLSPKNKLIFATGPVTGFPFPGNGRYGVYAKSPLTGFWCDGYASGYLGPEMKFAGVDAIIFEGRAEKPVYLWIHEGETELRDATHLWEKFTGETQSMIRREVGDDSARIASIGPGGEKLVRFACVLSDLKNSAGRCGAGAVMGSKNLKALAVSGTKKLRAADGRALRELAKKAREESWEGWGASLHKHGTGGSLDDLSESGRLPTQNFRRSTFERARSITGEAMSKTILIDRRSCFACAVACKRVVKATEPYDVDPAYGGPEYETLAAFGSLCMNDNLVAIAKANELCNKYTIDTISTGSAIAFAMECYEKGLLTKSDTDGVDLTWGNYKAIVQLVKKIGRREGLGDLLAEGVKRAAETIGGGSEKFAIHIKGMEVPMHEPRGKKMVGLSYATSNRGGCHVQSYHDDSFETEKGLAPELGITSEIVPINRLSTAPEKVRLTVLSQDWVSFINSGVFCRFTPYPAGMSVSTVVSLFTSITGWNMPAGEMMIVGERATNLCRAFNVREGLTRKDDTLHERLMEPLSDGVLKGEAIPRETLDRMLDQYYDYRRWDRDSGIPTRKKLEELELKYVADELEKLEKL